MVLYTDLNCPFCYATEERLEALGLEGEIEWRGVEHEPDLPVPMDTLDVAIAEQIEEEVASVASRAAEVEIARPPGLANTARALAAAAAGMRTDPERGRAFRRAVYGALWREGRDISDTSVLRELAEEHGLRGLEVSPEDELQVTRWRLAWERSPLRGIPLLIRHDGETLYGLKDSAELERFHAGA